MAAYRLDSLASLARQIGYAPASVRLEQMQAAELLLSEIEPNRAYPNEFIVFRITGFRGKTIAADQLAGMALQHDLGLLVEEISRGLGLRTDTSPEPVLSIADVTERFEVTSKTIQRWRRRGLASRQYIFPDGKRRVAFPLSSVERFVRIGSDTGAARFVATPLQRDEQSQLLAAAGRLLSSGCTQRELLLRLARRFNRSPNAVLHQLRQHDATSDQPMLSRAAAELSPRIARRLVSAIERGASLQDLARRLRRPRSTLARVVLDARLAKLGDRRVSFIDDELYAGDHALQQLQSLAKTDALPLVESVRMPRGLDPYLATLYRVPLLSPNRERALFLLFNYHKRLFVLARRRLDPELAYSRDLAALDRHLEAADRVRHEIIHANLRLVVSVARKHLTAGVTLMELVSEGNVSLMRAVESFDVHRGVRFSTYATLALMKGFARSVPQMIAQRTPTLLVEQADSQSHRLQACLEHRDQLRPLLNRLTPLERAAVSHEFGLPGAAMPLELSRRTLAAAQKSALAKLRAWAQ
jgi:RNA polymerase primary sigma factor